MVEEISQFDEDFSIAMEEIKNSTNLFAKGELIVQESSQNKHAQKKDLNIEEKWSGKLWY